MLKKSILFILLMFGSLSILNNYSNATNNDYANLNRYFKKYLNCNLLTFNELQENKIISLNSVFILPNLGENGLLKIEFDRKYFTETFIQDLFFTKKSDLQHLFTSEGFEASLTKEKLILSVHSGVIFKLSEDIGFDNNYKTFVSSDVTGMITAVSGKIMYSCDHELIRKYLDEFNIKYRGPRVKNEIVTKSDGTQEVTPIKIEKDMWMPPKYTPKVLYNH